MAKWRVVKDMERYSFKNKDKPTLPILKSLFPLAQVAE